MAKIPLTTMTVEKLTAGTYFDTKTPAFGIRVGKHRKTWIATKGRERKCITLGHYPAISLQDARRRALVAIATQTTEKPTILFPEALQLFLGQDRWRANSKRVIESSLKHFPWKGQLHKITHEQVIEALDDIEKPSARAHALKDIRTFFNWTIPRYLDHSPAQGIRMEAQPTRDRVLTEEELRRVWIACEQLGLYGSIVRALMLSGQRRGEIASLKLEWLHNDRITFPAEYVKNGKEHTIPLTSVLKREVEKLLSLRDTTKPFTAWSKSQSLLLKTAQVAHFTPHDLRRSFSTNQAKLGTPIHVTELLLNHVSGSLSPLMRIYNRHDYFLEKVEAMQKYENFVLSLARQ